MKKHENKWWDERSEKLNKITLPGVTMCQCGARLLLLRSGHKPGLGVLAKACCPRCGSKHEVWLSRPELHDTTIKCWVFRGKEQPLKYPPDFAREKIIETNFAGMKVTWKEYPDGTIIHNTTKYGVSTGTHVTKSGSRP